MMSEMKNWSRVVLATTTIACVVSCTAPPTPPPISSQPPAPSATTATATPSASPPGSTAAPLPTWQELCVVAPTRIPKEWQQKVPREEAWSDERITVRVVDGDLIADQDGQSHTIFNGDVEDEESTEPQDVFNGEIYGNSRWLVFISANSSYLGDPWRLHVVDRQDLSRPPRTVGQYTGESENPGFAYPALLGDGLTWTEPLPGDTYRIRHLNLTDGEPETIAEGKVQAARFLDETHILWQTLAEDDSITIDQHDLTTGNTSRVFNPISNLGASSGQLAVNGNFWVLANAPSGDPDSDSTTYDLWVWWPGREEAVRIAAFNAPAYLSTEHALHDGVLGLATTLNESFVVDLNTGIAQRVHDGWAILVPGEDVIKAELEAPREGDFLVKATIPLSEVAQPGECVGQLTD